MSAPLAHPLLADRRWLYREYVTRDRSTAQIAAELACNDRTIRRALNRLGIERRTPGRRVENPRLRDARWLRAQWRARRRVKEIADVLGCAESTVRKALKRTGVAEFKRHPTIFDHYPLLADRAWLAARYECVGSPEIAAEIGTNPTAVLTALRRHGIAVRSAGRAGRPLSG